MSSNENGKNVVLEADLVVIGGGGAGLPAALTAVDEGVRKVIVLEKRFAAGGDALRCNHIFAVGTHLQKEAGVTITADEIYRNALTFHRFDRVNPVILRTLINNTADSIHWMEGKGVEFKLLVSHHPDPKTVTTHVEKSMPEPDSLCSLGKVFKHLIAKSKDAGIQFMFRTTPKKILRGEDGKVTGIIAKTKGGEEFTIKTNAVILCPGSFNGNKELLKKYFPFYWSDVYVTDALLSNTGDGIPIAEDAGAALSDTCCLIRHSYSFETTVNNRCHGAAHPGAVKVNKKGQRYLAEDMRDIGGNTVVQQPEMTVYGLYDDNIVQAVVDRNNPPQHPRIQAPPESVPDFREYLKKQTKIGPWVKIVDTLAEAADWIGCDPDALQATMDRYHTFCDQGYDEDFAKDPEFLIPLRTPPYYVIKFVPLMIESIGPVVVNEKMEVLDKQDKEPIPGFYAAGVITSGWESYDYGGTPAGTALSFSITSGRIAGKSAVKYLKGE